MRCGRSKSLPSGTKLRIKITTKEGRSPLVGRIAYATAEGDIGIGVARVEPSEPDAFGKVDCELRDAEKSPKNQSTGFAVCEWN